MILFQIVTKIVVFGIFRLYVSWLVSKSTVICPLYNKLFWKSAQETILLRESESQNESNFSKQQYCNAADFGKTFFTKLQFLKKLFTLCQILKNNFTTRRIFFLKTLQLIQFSINFSYNASDVGIFFYSASSIDLKVSHVRI